MVILYGYDFNAPPYRHSKVRTHPTRAKTANIKSCRIGPMNKCYGKLTLGKGILGHVHRWWHYLSWGRPKHPLPYACASKEGGHQHFLVKSCQPMVQVISRAVLKSNDLSKCHRTRSQIVWSGKQMDSFSGVDVFRFNEFEWVWRLDTCTK